MAEWPRQPRSGNPENEAEVASRTTRFYVRLKNTSDEFTSAFYVSSQARAEEIVDNLNEIFAIPGADLDFITPGYKNGAYVVLWSGTKWFQDQSYADTTNAGKTYENLYAGCVKYNSEAGENYKYYKASNSKVIATITSSDAANYDMDEWELALEWANAIRNIVNGWNCSKDSTGDLVHNGKINRLAVPDTSYTGNRSITATYYGAGERQPAFTTANNDIFHTCDLTVARPKGTTYLSIDSWVKVTYNGKSIVARVTDTCGTSALDLSCGLATALDFTSGTVTISAP